VCGLLVFAICLSLAAPLLAADPEPPSPAVRLYDVPKARALGGEFDFEGAWKLVPEDTLEHKFDGWALVTNDKLAFIVKRNGDMSLGNVLEVYTRKKAPVNSPTLVLTCSHCTAVRSTPQIRIVENNSSAVTLELRRKANDGSEIAIAFRLTAGQPIMEIRPRAQVDRVHIVISGHRLVIPNYFGDDMAFFPLNPPGRTIFLPAENFFLNLVSGEPYDTMAVCAWTSIRQDVSVSGDNYLVQCIADKPIWLALLGGCNIWRIDVPYTANTPRFGGGDDWKPPFPAKWRGNIVGEGMPPRSWFLKGTDTAPPITFPRQDGGRKPGQPLLSLYYPIDRDRQTPLDVFTPMDVLRNTLGVGPCQYILQTEGLGSESNPTPDNVMTWVEKQFARKKQKKSADEIREMLGQMGSQVAATQARIERYAAFARELHKLVDGKELMPAGATGMMSLQQTLVYLDRSLADDTSAKAAERTQQLAAEVAALMEKADAADECRKLGAEARQIGLAQERTLARCRMAVRWVHAQAKMAAAETAADVKTLELAKTVQARTEEILYAR